MVELLAPAGNKECFLTALAAGADAIYIGGEKFGARAYADNFSQQDVIWAIDTAHLYHKKVYLTVNTLMKENELDALIPYLVPFYEAGLDGVIVQDFGAMTLMRKEFPLLELHASTQMTVTGSLGAALLGNAGICRIVPARELSLEEIIKIKKETGLSIETFIHGAMCYAYSGQCLFSSMLGPRSGNRGRCAGPCRLMYQAYCDGKKLNDQNSLYQLSLKDLCSLDILPELIEAGIDSFKIEGRMKSKEYVSCVTAIYRNYIDAYYENPKAYCVSETDKNILRQSFSRGSLESGYYFAHNGRKLVTLQKPGYQSFAVEDGVAGEKNQILPGGKSETSVKGTEDGIMRIPVTAYFSAYAGKEMTLTVMADDHATVTVTGPLAEPSISRPADPAEVKKALSKTGNTPFEMRTIEVDMGGDLFLVHKSLNALRREALSQLFLQMTGTYHRTYEPVEESEASDFVQYQEKDYPVKRNREKPVMHVRVESLKQFLALSDGKYIERIYLASDCLTEEVQQPGRYQKDFLCRYTAWKDRGTEIYLAFPAVCRYAAIEEIEKISDWISKLSFDGFLVNNLESLQYLREKFPGARICSDSRFYAMNTSAVSFLASYGIEEHLLPIELHEKEIRQLVRQCGEKLSKQQFFLPVYGYIPVMESAGCILQTNGNCQKGKKTDVTLTDRQNKQLKVLCHCGRCENTIYHSYPLSLHKEMGKIASLGISGIVLSFSWESEKQMNRLVKWYETLMEAAGMGMKLPINENEMPFSDFTKGHFAKGVE